MEEKIFDRSLEQVIKKWLHRKEIIGIKGARQTGKTTLLKKIAKVLPREQCAFINLDRREYRDTLKENPIDFVNRFKKPEKKLFLFLDEIQNVPNAGEQLKIIYDELPDVKIIMSGSSSLELKVNVLPQLVGRLFLFELFPFNFSEFLNAREEGLYRLYIEKQKSLKDFLSGKAKEINPPSFHEDFLRLWMQFIIWGGYPEVIKSNNEEEKKIIIKNIIDLYLDKDIVNFFRIEESSKFENLVRYNAFNIGNLLNISDISNELNLNYQKVQEFINILEHTYIIHLLKPFFKNSITELKKATKVYFIDSGIRNAVINNFLPFQSRTDRGVLAENFVFTELLTDFQDYQINFWRTTGKAEVDFVLRKTDTIIPVEVKSSGNSIGKSFYSFINTYKPKRALIVTLNKFRKQNIQDTTIYWVPIYYF